MDREYYPAARWCGLLHLATWLCMALMAGLLAAGLWTGPREMPVWTLFMVGMPLAFLVISPLFAVRGYAFENGNLRVRRLGWSSNLELGRVEEVYADPDAMKRSIRLFGNGGLFCFAGLFRNKALGNYRAFVTNPAHAVVIRTEDRVIVVSPRDPAALVAAVREQSGMPAVASPA